MILKRFKSSVRLFLIAPPLSLFNPAGYKTLLEPYWAWNSVVVSQTTRLRPAAAENIRPDNGWDKLRSYRIESIATLRRFYIPQSYTMWPSRRHAVVRLLCPSSWYYPGLHAIPSYCNDTIFSLNICKAFGTPFSRCNLSVRNDGCYRHINCATCRTMR
jgi:hypothetical protein